VNTWLVAITRHHAIDILRWQNSRPDVKSLSLHDMLPAGGSDAPDPEAHVEISLQQARVRAAVAQLPAEQRQVLVLAYFKGYTHRQIAEVLDQPNRWEPSRHGFAWQCRNCVKRCQKRPRQRINPKTLRMRIL
jgi:RNA polymerase sigma-70 factor (ECF subfamily)